MPSIAPIALTVSGASETYNPASHAANRTMFTDQSGSRLVDWRSIRVDVRPASAGNSGHVVEFLLVRPNPVVDQAGCCVDKDAAPASTVTIRTLLHKTSSAAQADALVDMIKAFVAKPEFASLVKGSSFY